MLYKIGVRWETLPRSENRRKKRSKPK